MKIVTILGSPRPQSISSTIARRFQDTAATLGAETQCFALNRLVYQGCQGCYACKKNLDHCILNDDLTGVLNAVTGADAVVLSSPVYYGDVTAQLKGYIDRNFSYLKPDYTTNAVPSRLSGKKLVFVLSQGHPDEAVFADIFPRYNSFLKWLGFTETHLIRVCGVGPSTVDSAPEPALAQAEELARQLAGDKQLMSF